MSPDSSHISRVRYSKTPAMKAPEEPPSLWAYLPFLIILLRRPTGNTVYALYEPVTLLALTPDFLDLAGIDLRLKLFKKYFLAP